MITYSTDQIPEVCEWLLRYSPPIQCVTLGGSRARGLATPTSDFDVFVFTEDELFHKFVRNFPQFLVDGFGPLFSVRPPTLTRGFGFQFSGFSERLGAVDYFLVAPFVIQPFDHFGHHLVVFDHDDFFNKLVLPEERLKNSFSTAGLLDSFEFRLFSLYAETKHNLQKGELFQAEQALLELRSHAYGVIKTLISGELFDFASKGRRGDQQASAYYDMLEECVRRSGMSFDANCADAIISILIQALKDSQGERSDTIEQFAARLNKLLKSDKQ